VRRVVPESWAPLGLLLLSLLLYGRSVAYPFVLDDRMAIVGNDFLRSPENPLRFFISDYSRGADFGPGYFRPLMMFTFWLQGSLAGWGPAGFHLVNIVLHALAAWCLFLAARGLGTGAGAAALGAALFAVYPPGHEPAASIVGRADLLATIFLLLGWRMQLAWEQGRMSTAKAAVALSTCGLLAMLGKETAAVFPVLVIATSLFYGWKVAPESRRAISRVILALLALLTLAVYLVLRHAAVVAAPGAGPIASLPQPQRILAALYLTGQLLLSLAWPFHRPSVVLSFAADRVFPLDGAVDPRVLLPACALVLLVAGVILLWRKRRLPALPLVLALVALLPVSNLLVPTASFLGERFLYMPFAGVALAAAAAWDMAGARLASLPASREAVRVTAWAVAASSIIFLGGTAFTRAGEWRSEEAIARAWSARFPNEPMVWNRLGIAALERNDPEAARDRFQRSLALDPGNARVNLRLGMVLSRLGRWAEAEAPLERAVTLVPTDPEPRIALSRAYLSLGRAGDAVREAEDAYALRPALPAARQALGSALFEDGRYGEAAAMYRLLVGDEPQSALLRHGLILSLDKAGRTADAEAEAREAARRIPGNPLFDLWCARFAAREDRSDEVLLHLGKARRDGAPVGRWLDEVEELRPFRNDPRARSLAGRSDP
jgi:Flp pilus assembly protein TadD